MLINIKNIAVIRVSIVALGCLAVLGCALPKKPPAPEPAPQLPLIKPEIDFSAETPDCETAGLRLAEHIEPGMTLGDVKRLVGKPIYKFPGSWWWSRGLDKVGKPWIEFPLLVNRDDIGVSKVHSDTSGC